MGYVPQLINTNVKCEFNESVNLYLYLPTAYPKLTSGISANDKVLNVDSNAGIINGDAITIYEDIYFFQSIVKSTTPAPGATITLQSPSDKVFTTSAIIETGTVNANKNGSVTPVEFSIRPPCGLNFNIRSLNIEILDNADMDSSKFGGISALPNGLIIRHENGIYKNITLIYNNAGFSHQGFNTEYDDKAPAGVYGIRHRLDFLRINGIAVQLTGCNNDKITLYIQDNLSDLSAVITTVQGHVVDL